MDDVGFVVFALGARPYGFQVLLEGPPVLACVPAGKLDVVVESPEVLDLRIEAE